MMPAREVLRLLAEHRTDEVYVTTMTASRFWDEFSTKRELDLPIRGAMGKASSVGLGIALARPDRRVVVLDGDGSLLMNLGSLVTIAGQTPENLIHLVFHNTVYATTGGQPVPGVGRYSLALLARGAGYRHAHQIDDLTIFKRELPRFMCEPGPTLVDMLVQAPSDLPPFLDRKTPQAVRELKAALAKGQAS